MGKTRKLLRRCLVLAVCAAVAVPTVAWATGNEPTTVPVLYEPPVPVPTAGTPPLPGDYPTTEPPAEADFFVLTPIPPLTVWSGDNGTVGTLEDGTVYPQPDKPAAHSNYYAGSALTAAQSYTKDVATRAWRYVGSSECYDVLGDYGPISCSVLRSKFADARDEDKLGADSQQICLRRSHGHRKCYTNAMYIAELYYGVKGRVKSWQGTVATYEGNVVAKWNEWVEEEMSWANTGGTITSELVVRADGTEPVEIPKYYCVGVTPTQPVCEPSPNDTAESLTGNRREPISAETWTESLEGSDLEEIPEATALTIDALVQFVADYTYEYGTVTVSDSPAAYAQWLADRNKIDAHNLAQRTARMEKVKNNVAVFDQAAYNAAFAAHVPDLAFRAARVAYDDRKAADEKAVTDYDTAHAAYKQDRRDQGDSMFVDCRLSGCVVVNPVR